MSKQLLFKKNINGFASNLYNKYKINFIINKLFLYFYILLGI